MLENHLMEKTYNNWPEWQTLYVEKENWPEGVVRLCLGATYLYKKKKNMTKYV